MSPVRQYTDEEIMGWQWHMPCDLCNTSVPIKKALYKEESGQYLCYNCYHESGHENERVNPR